MDHSTDRDHIELAAIVGAAWERRRELHADPDTDAYRVLHGWTEGALGLEIDRYGDGAIIRHGPDYGARLDEIAAALEARHRFAWMVAKPRGGEPRVLRGPVPERCEVQDAGLVFTIEPGRRGNPGLFLDSRPVRRWIRDHAAGRRVLNLFAFTGSLGVAAAAGGAARVTHVDAVRSALELCRENHQQNGVPVDDRDLVRVNVYQHLRKAGAGRRRFDAVIVDPPPLKAIAKRTDRTPGGHGIHGLAPLVTRLLEPGGWVVCLFHHDPRSHDALEAEFQAAAAVPLEVMWRGTSGDDFPETEPTRKLRVSAFTMTIQRTPS